MSRTALRGLVPVFLKDLSARGFAVRTCETYRQRMRFFLEYLEAGGVSRPGELTRDVLQGYQTHLHQQRGTHGRRLALSTQAHSLTIIRSFCRFLARRELILVDPSRDLELPKVQRRLPTSILTTREVLTFLKAINLRSRQGIRDRAMFETLYSTGLRVGELVTLTPADVDLEAGFVRVRRGKGGKARVVPLGRVAARWIQRYLESARPDASPDIALFLSVRAPHKPRPLDRDTMSDRVRHWARVAGLSKRVTCHSWRHACATHMLQGKASLRHIQELLGHAQLTTTQRYTHVTILDLKRIHQKCHPRGRP